MFFFDKSSLQCLDEALKHRELQAPWRQEFFQKIPVKYMLDNILEPRSCSSLLFKVGPYCVGNDLYRSQPSGRFSYANRWQIIIFLRTESRITWPSMVWLRLLQSTVLWMNEGMNVKEKIHRVQKASWGRKGSRLWSSLQSPGRAEVLYWGATYSTRAGATVGTSGI